MVEVIRRVTADLSFYRTKHRFARYGEFAIVEEFLEYLAWAKARGCKVFILGNGSNTLFTRRCVRTLVLRNRLERRIEPTPDGRFEISSSVLIAAVLRFCQERSLDSFYYLASVPGTIGGALAMNAGRGRVYGMTIYDYVESVSFVEDGVVKTVAAQDLPRDYRTTRFTGVQDCLITKAVFRFPRVALEGDPIQERLRWAREHQDLSGPTCGTVFQECSRSVLRRLRGLRIGGAAYSRRTSNWIINRDERSGPIVLLIGIAKAIHRILGRVAKLELVEVD